MGAVVGGGQEGEDEEMRQAKEQAAARRRWEALVRFLNFPYGSAHFVYKIGSCNQFENAVLLG